MSWSNILFKEARFAFLSIFGIWRAIQKKKIESKVDVRKRRKNESWLDMQIFFLILPTAKIRNFYLIRFANSEWDQNKSGPYKIDFVLFSC